jgi:hypothetical protein
MEGKRDPTPCRRRFRHHPSPYGGIAPGARVSAGYRKRLTAGPAVAPCPKPALAAVRGWRSVGTGPPIRFRPRLGIATSGSGENRVPSYRERPAIPRIQVVVAEPARSRKGRARGSCLDGGARHIMGRSVLAPLTRAGPLIVAIVVAVAGKPARGERALIPRGNAKVPTTASLPFDRQNQRGLSGLPEGSR